MLTLNLVQLVLQDAMDRLFTNGSERDRGALELVGRHLTDIASSEPHYNSIGLLVSRIWFRLRHNPPHGVSRVHERVAGILRDTVGVPLCKRITESIDQFDNDQELAQALHHAQFLRDEPD